MVCLSDSRRSSSLCSMYCASLTLAQTCNYCLCLTSIRETKPCPLDNLYTAAAFPSVTQDMLKLFCISCCAEDYRQWPSDCSGCRYYPQPVLSASIQTSCGQWKRKHHKQYQWLGNWPYMAWKELQEGISMEEAVGPFLNSAACYKWDNVRLCQKATR